MCRLFKSCILGAPYCSVGGSYVFLVCVFGSCVILVYFVVVFCSRYATYSIVYGVCVGLQPNKGQGKTSTHKCVRLVCKHGAGKQHTISIG